MDSINIFHLYKIFEQEGLPAIRFFLPPCFVVVSLLSWACAAVPLRCMVEKNPRKSDLIIAGEEYRLTAVLLGEAAFIFYFVYHG